MLSSHAEASTEVERRVLDVGVIQHAFRIQLDRQRCNQQLTLRVVAALQARTGRLALTFEQPRAQDSRRALKLLGQILAKLGKCAAVQLCKLSRSAPTRPDLECPPGLAQRLLDSFPSLTALTIHGYSVTCSGLASLVCHPQLALHLQQLDLPSTVIKQPREPGPGAVSRSNLFQHAKLVQLSFDDCEGGLLPDLQPLAQHLTQLRVGQFHGTLIAFTSAMGALPQLQVLTARCWHHGGLYALPQLLQALPRLHTLNLPGATVQGQRQLVELLAATQLTSVHVGGFRDLDKPCAGLPCSWQRLEVTGIVDCTSAACLPLTSLTQPLVLGNLLVGHPSVSIPVVSAAVLNLTQACKVPVNIRVLELSMCDNPAAAAGPRLPPTAPAIGQQRAKLQQLVVVLRELHSIELLTISNMPESGVAPSLEFWRQLVQLMPTISYVYFMDCKGSDTEAMCESLVMMAEQPWARWLDIIIDITHYRYQLSECCQATNSRFDNPASPAIFRLSTRRPGSMPRDLSDPAQPPSAKSLSPSQADAASTQASHKVIVVSHPETADARQDGALLALLQHSFIVLGTPTSQETNQHQNSAEGPAHSRQPLDAAAAATSPGNGTGLLDLHGVWGRGLQGSTASSPGLTQAGVSHIPSSFHSSCVISGHSNAWLAELTTPWSQGLGAGAAGAGTAGTAFFSAPAATPADNNCPSQATSRSLGYIHMQLPMRPAPVASQPLPRLPASLPSTLDPTMQASSSDPMKPSTQRSSDPTPTPQHCTFICGAVPRHSQPRVRTFMRGSPSRSSLAARLLHAGSAQTAAAGNPSQGAAASVGMAVPLARVWPPNPGFSGKDRQGGGVGGRQLPGSWRAGGSLVSGSRLARATLTSDLVKAVTLDSSGSGASAPQPTAALAGSLQQLNLAPASWQAGEEALAQGYVLGDGTDVSSGSRSGLLPGPPWEMFDSEAKAGAHQASLPDSGQQKQGRGRVLHGASQHCSSPDPEEQQQNRAAEVEPGCESNSWPAGGQDDSHRSAPLFYWDPHNMTGGQGQAQGQAWAPLAGSAYSHSCGKLQLGHGVHGAGARRGGRASSLVLVSRTSDLMSIQEGEEESLSDSQQLDSYCDAAARQHPRAAYPCMRSLLHGNPGGEEEQVLS
ncbi:hypothetical protein V8C86DRAFT_2435560 [Haematococcus lacustris]